MPEPKDESAVAAAIAQLNAIIASRTPQTATPTTPAKGTQTTTAPAPKAPNPQREGEFTTTQLTAQGGFPVQAAPGYYAVPDGKGGVFLYQAFGGYYSPVTSTATKQQVGPSAVSQMNQTLVQGQAQTVARAPVANLPSGPVTQRPFAAATQGNAGRVGSGRTNLPSYGEDVRRIFINPFESAYKSQAPSALANLYLDVPEDYNPKNPFAAGANIAEGIDFPYDLTPTEGQAPSSELVPTGTGTAELRGGDWGIGFSTAPAGDFPGAAASSILASNGYESTGDPAQDAVIAAAIVAAQQSGADSNQIRPSAAEGAPGRDYMISPWGTREYASPSGEYSDATLKANGLAFAKGGKVDVNNVPRYATGGNISSIGLGRYGPQPGAPVEEPVTSLTPDGSYAYVPATDPVVEGSILPAPEVSPYSPGRYGPMTPTPVGGTPATNIGSLGSGRNQAVTQGTFGRSPTNPYGGSTIPPWRAEPYNMGGGGARPPVTSGPDNPPVGIPETPGGGYGPEFPGGLGNNWQLPVRNASGWQGAIDYANFENLFANDAYKWNMAGIRPSFLQSAMTDDPSQLPALRAGQYWTPFDFAGTAREIGDQIALAGPTGNPQQIRQQIAGLQAQAAGTTDDAARASIYSQIDALQDQLNRAVRATDQRRSLTILNGSPLPGFKAGGMVQGGNSMTTPEEIVGVGRFTGKPYFRLGENVPPGGNLTGHPGVEMMSFPRPDKMKITPMGGLRRGAATNILGSAMRGMNERQQR